MVELGSSSDYMGKERGIATIYYTDGNDIKQELVVKSPHNTSSSCDLNRLQFTGQAEYKRWCSLPRQSPLRVSLLSLKLSVNNLTGLL
jgi:hypothetical protein